MVLGRGRSEADSNQGSKWVRLWRGRESRTTVRMRDDAA